jgi:hypothetical protein
MHTNRQVSRKASPLAKPTSLPLKQLLVFQQAGFIPPSHKEGQPEGLFEKIGLFLLFTLSSYLSLLIVS